MIPRVDGCESRPYASVSHPTDHNRHKNSPSWPRARGTARSRCGTCTRRSSSRRTPTTRTCWPWPSAPTGRRSVLVLSSTLVCLYTHTNKYLRPTAHCLGSFLSCTYPYIYMCAYSNRPLDMTKPTHQQLCVATLNGRLYFWDVQEGHELGSIDGRRDIAGGRGLRDKVHGRMRKVTLTSRPPPPPQQNMHTHTHCAYST